jgi:flagellar biogenesis protein FliO
VEFAIAGRLLAALAVIALVLGALRLTVRLGGRPFARRARLVEILETQFLPGGTSLHVVGVLGRYYLVGRGAHVSLLGELPADEIAERIARTA